MFEHQQSVIFDLGGVLVKDPEMNLEKSGLKNVTDIKLYFRIFEFASLIFGEGFAKSYFTGRILAADVVKRVYENIDKKEFDNFFKSYQERNIIKYSIEWLLLPKNSNELCDLFEEGINFVQKCKQHKFKVLILSNWDPDSFELMKNKFSDFFKLFNEENIFTSANTGLIKPEPEIYRHVLKKGNLLSDEVFFIDDNLGNVVSAKNCGIKSVCHTNWQNTEQELKNLGLKIK